MEQLAQRSHLTLKLEPSHTQQRMQNVAQSEEQCCACINTGVCALGVSCTFPFSPCHPAISPPLLHAEHPSCFYMRVLHSPSTSGAQCVPNILHPVLPFRGSACPLIPSSVTGYGPTCFLFSSIHPSSLRLAWRVPATLPASSLCINLQVN